MHGPIPREALTGSIPRWFDQVVECHADRPAVRYDGAEIRYRALRDAAHAVVAHILERAPRSPGAVVILVRQGIEQITAILGVLQAGDWYVPLDRSLAPARLRSLIERAEAKLVIADRTTRAHAEAAAQGIAPVVCIE